MSSRYVPCNRSFNSDNSLQQHKRESSAHTFDCRTCDRHYGSGTALQQHLRDSPVHAPSFNCRDCNLFFSKEEALRQHLRNSPAHAFDCNDCDLSFSNEEALQQHLRVSPAHNPSFECVDCDQAFDCEEAWLQHLRELPVHDPAFNCDDCDRAFDCEEAWLQHLRELPVYTPSFDSNETYISFDSDETLQQHQRDTETPLDIFFRSFPTFEYDPTLSPATSYANLRRHEGWRHGSPASDDAWDRYQDALQSELDKWYGAEDDLTAWHALCRAIGVEPLPQTCEQCETAVRRTHVNIVDLIEWGRSNSKKKVQTFGTVTELRAYTKETGKIFRNTLKQKGGNVVLRHLLRKIFSESL